MRGHLKGMVVYHINEFGLDDVVRLAVVSVVRFRGCSVLKHVNDLVLSLHLCLLLLPKQILLLQHPLLI